MYFWKMKPFNRFIDKTQNIFDFTLLKLGEHIEIKAADLFAIVILIAVASIVLYVIKRGVYKTTKFDLGKKYSIYNLIRYTFVVIVFAWCLDILGFNLKIILAGSAALLVGIGLGLQNLFSDFISGLILLVDSSIKVGDIIDIDGLVCQVQQIHLRTTLVLTRDDKYILLPNTQLTKNQLINWTHSVTSSRFNVDIHIAYDSDVDLVTRVLLEACEQQPEVLKNPAPFVRFTNFGQSALNFSVYFWCDNVFRVENVKSALRYKIFKLCAENNITIPFPQRTLHFHHNANDLTINNEQK